MSTEPSSILAQGGSCQDIASQQIIAELGDDTTPIWSPNGLFIAYTAFRTNTPAIHMQAISGASYFYEIGALTFDHAVDINLTVNAPIGARSSDPSWSPNGNQLVFVSTASTNVRMHVMELSFSNDTIRLLSPDWTITGTISPVTLAPYGGPHWSMPEPLIIDTCIINVLPPGGVSFRYAPSTSGNDPLFIVNPSGTITTLNNFSGQWDNVPGGNPVDWAEGTSVTLNAIRWSQSSETAWLSVTARNNVGVTIEGYMALRSSGTVFLSLGCAENSLPGYSGLPPTATPGPSPTPNPSNWYVICTLRPNEPPPIELNVRTEPNLQSDIIEILGLGDRVERTSLNPNDEVQVVVPGGAIIFVEVVWSDSATGSAWVARQDTLGALLEPVRSVSCPPTPVPTTVPPATPTPDPRIPSVDPWRFSDPPGGYQSAFGGFAPANVGKFGIHDLGTIDIMPSDLEECIDTSTNAASDSCDPSGETGIPIYAPVSGWAVGVNNNQNVVIFWENEFDRTDDETSRSVRREILLIHLHPERLQFNSGGEQVTRGQLLGYLCRHNDRDQCGIPTGGTDIEFAVNHLAVQVRFFHSGGEGFSPTPEEVLGVLAIPNCIFDDWVEDHLTRTRKDPDTATWLNNWFAGCPS